MKGPHAQLNSIALYKIKNTKQRVIILLKINYN